MIIDELNVYHVAMPLIDPWITSYGADYEIHSILIHSKSEHHETWAETCGLELPTYSYESANSIYYNITEIFGKNIIGKETICNICLLSAPTGIISNPVSPAT